MTDYAHSDAAAKSRAEKARRLATYLWHRGITESEVLAMPTPVRRKLARAAGTNPPSTDETWTVAGRLLTEKDDWAARHPRHPAARREHTDEKLLWVKPPITPWS
ncbi:hypothetical protein ABTW96_09945 [Nocardia beijingensis]|uniref:hypothetical protein n=1 Tax=Nocardia beijingensis TaxID=95162 RepID=UPI00332AB324